MERIPYAGIWHMVGLWWVQSLQLQSVCFPTDLGGDTTALVAVGDSDGGVSAQQCLSLPCRWMVVESMPLIAGKRLKTAAACGRLLVGHWIIVKITGGRSALHGRAWAKLRSVIDPKRHYKKSDSKTLPKYFQVGTVVEPVSEYFSSRLTRRQRKATLTDELLSDRGFHQYRKRKVSEIEDERRAASGVSKWREKKKKHKSRKPTH